MDIDHKDTLKLAETESSLWAEAQNLLIHTLDDSFLPVEPMVQAIPSKRCFTDGSWKTKEPFSGQRWYSTLEDFDGLVGARNTRAAQSPLHSEIEALIWQWNVCGILGSLRLHLQRIVLS